MSNLPIIREQNSPPNNADNNNNNNGDNRMSKIIPQWINLIIVVLAILIGGAFAAGNITKEISTLSEKVDENNANLKKLYENNYNDIKKITEKVAEHTTGIELANERIKTIITTITTMSNNRR